MKTTQGCPHIRLKLTECTTKEKIDYQAIGNSFSSSFVIWSLIYDLYILIMVDFNMKNQNASWQTVNILILYYQLDIQ
jgi:hypothetical protein